MMETTVTANASPRPVYRVIVVTCVAVIVALIMLGLVLAITYSGTASSHDVEAQGRRRDCVTTIQSARRSVFDNVDIYKAIQIDQLSTALLNGQSGIKASDADIKAFADNQKLLDKALVQARKVQPAVTLDRIVAHGGMIDGVRYDACPG